MPAIDAIAGLLQRNDPPLEKLAFARRTDVITDMASDRTTFALTIVFALIGLGLATSFVLYLIRHCRRQSQPTAGAQRRRRHLESTAVADGDFARLPSTRVSMEPSHHDRASQEQDFVYSDAFEIETEISMPAPTLDQPPLYVDRRDRASAISGLATIMERSGEMEQNLEDLESYAQPDV